MNKTRIAEMVRDDPLVRQFEHFGATVRGDVEPLVTARDGLANPSHHRGNRMPRNPGNRST